MKIGIIGAGPIGVTLARKFSQAGHSVKIANSRGPETLADVAAKTGATAVTVSDVVKEVDVVVVSILLKGFQTLRKDIFANVPDDVVVVDTGNYYPVRDGRIEAIDQGMLESHWISKQLGRPVVKAFNAMSFPNIELNALPKGTPGRIAMPVAGDDARAKAIVMDLVDVVGFDGVDAGSIEDSWRQQPGTPVYCTDRDAEGVRLALTRAVKERSTKNRDDTWNLWGAIPHDIEPHVFVNFIRETCRTFFDPDYSQRTSHR